MLQQAFMCFTYRQSYSYMCMLTEQNVTIYENIKVAVVLARVTTLSQLMMFPNMLCLQNLVSVHRV